MTSKNTQNKISQIAIKFQFTVPVIKTNEVLNFWVNKDLKYMLAIASVELWNTQDIKYNTCRALHAIFLTGEGGGVKDGPQCERQHH